MNRLLIALAMLGCSASTTEPTDAFEALLIQDLRGNPELATEFCERLFETAIMERDACAVANGIEDRADPAFWDQICEDWTTVEVCTLPVGLVLDGYRLETQHQHCDVPTSEAGLAAMQANSDAQGNFTCIPNDTTP